MMIEFVLAAYLGSRPAITALVGNPARIHAEKTPQGVTGARIVYVAAGGDRNYHSQGPSGLAEAAIRFTFHANEGGVIDKATELYEAVRNEIDGFQGTMGDVRIERCVISMPAYGSALPSGGDEVGCPAVNALVQIHFQESLPTGVP